MFFPPTEGSIMLTPEQGTTPAGASRRTVLKGAAWAAPVIAASTAVPLAAASDGPTATTLYPSTFSRQQTYGYRPDESLFRIDMPIGSELWVEGLDTPAGTTLTLSFDSRLFPRSPGLTFDQGDGGKVAVPFSDSVSGGVRTAVYVLNFPLATGEFHTHRYLMEFEHVVPSGAQPWPADGVVHSTTLVVTPSAAAAPGSTGGFEQWDVRS